MFPTKLLYKNDILRGSGVNPIRKLGWGLNPVRCFLSNGVKRKAVAVILGILFASSLYVIIGSHIFAAEKPYQGMTPQSLAPINLTSEEEIRDRLSFYSGLSIKELDELSERMGLRYDQKVKLLSSVRAFNEFFYSLRDSYFFTNLDNKFYLKIPKSLKSEFSYKVSDVDIKELRGKYSIGALDFEGVFEGDNVKYNPNELRIIDAYKKVGRSFNNVFSISSPEGFIFIWIFPDREEMIKVFGVDVHSGGATKFPGFIGIPFSTKKAFNKTLLHEFVHVFVNHHLGFKKDDLPKWFHEGLAHYFDVIFFGASIAAVPTDDYRQWYETFKRMEKFYGPARFIAFIKNSLNEGSVCRSLEADLGIPNCSYDRLVEKIYNVEGRRKVKRILFILALYVLSLFFMLVPSIPKMVRYIVGRRAILIVLWTLVIAFVAFGGAKLIVIGALCLGFSSLMVFFRARSKSPDFLIKYGFRCLERGQLKEALSCFKGIDYTEGIKKTYYKAGEGDPIRREIVAYLGEKGGIPEAILEMDLLRDSDPEIRKKALEVLDTALPSGAVEGGKYTKILIEALKDNIWTNRKYVVNILDRVIREDGIETGKFIDPLISLLDDSSWQVRRAVVRVLGKIDDPKTIQALLAMLRDEHETEIVKEEVKESLRELILQS